MNNNLILKLEIEHPFKGLIKFHKLLAAISYLPIVLKETTLLKSMPNFLYDLERNPPKCC